MFTGIKGIKPLVFLDPGLSCHVRPDDPNDLTVVYKIIERFV
jgi:hypothetical protein